MYNSFKEGTGSQNGSCETEGWVGARRRGVVAERKGGNWETVGGRKKNSLGRKLTLYDGRWERVKIVFKIK